jgi:glycine hydroxymethyltransferase
MVLCQKELAEIVDRGCPLVLGGPLQHIIAAKSIALAEASQPSFADYARRIVDNAAVLAEALVAKGVRVVTGGTENHLILVDVRPFNLTGRQAEAALRTAGVTLNRNVIPNDPNGAWYTSGLRLGTPALTTLGMGASEMREIADLVHTTLSATQAENIAKGPNAGSRSKANYRVDAKVCEAVARRAAELLRQFPLYPGLEL